MPPKPEILVRWLPRGVAVLFGLFLSLFALDVFRPGVGLAQLAGEYLVHLLPTFLVFGVMGAAWRREWVGVAGFPALGVLYLALFWGRVHPSAYLLIAGPLFLLGALYLVPCLRGRAHRPPAL